MHLNSHEAVAKDVFRDAMRHLGTAVSIVTTDGSAGRCGMTVTAVSPVSDEPPIVLVCLNKTAYTCQVLTRNGVFAVNLLTVGTEHLSDAFAGRGDHEMDKRFDLAEWHHHPSGTGAPILHQSRVTLDCSVKESLDSGTHRVFFGLVTAVHFGQTHLPPLIYLDRGYTTTS